MKQKAEYEWLPLSCKHCRVFEHSDARCNKEPKVQQ